MTNEPRHEKTVYAICEQQRRSSAGVISTVGVCCFNSIIPLLAIAKVSILQLATVDEQTGLSLAWSQTRKTGFFVTWLKCTSMKAFYCHTF